jgi:hypothetical protein
LHAPELLVKGVESAIRAGQGIRRQQGVIPLGVAVPEDIDGGSNDLGIDDVDWKRKETLDRVGHLAPRLSIDGFGQDKDDLG